MVHGRRTAASDVCNLATDQGRVLVLTAHVEAAGQQLTTEIGQ